MFELSGSIRIPSNDAKILAVHSAQGISGPLALVSVFTFLGLLFVFVRDAVSPKKKQPGVESKPRPPEGNQDLLD
jgi:hypothetical protein